MQIPSSADISPKHSPNNHLVTGVRYYTEGIRLLWHPQLRIYILVPLLVNLVLFTLLTSLIIYYFGMATDWMLGFLPSWLAFLSWLAWLAWLVMGSIVLIIYGYSFNLITNFIAAPFYGLLAEKTEILLTGKTWSAEPIAKMIPRVTWRELVKLCYFIMRGIFIILIVALIAMIPGINFLAPLIGLAWSAWSMSIQYADYPADNHQLKFSSLRDRLRKNLYSSLGFGCTIMAASVVPVINIFAMPAAVTGSVIFWLNELAEE